MKALTAGHRYELDNVEGGTQPLQFIHKVPKENHTSEMYTVSNGTTNEEVITVLIDRLNYLNDKFPCTENEIAILHLESALNTLIVRTAKRQLRGVEGKHEA